MATPYRHLRNIFSQGSNESKSSVISGECKRWVYEITYQPPPESNAHVNLRVAVLNDSGVLFETIPSGASILTDAGSLEVVDFVLSGEANQPRSEFELIQEDSSRWRP
ncbi:MAG: hypothetical protein WKF37_18440 [Bryobacteraceae bacterium]